MKVGFFRSPEHFARHITPEYRRLPFRFIRWGDGRVFLSNDAGEWTFLQEEAFSSFVSGTLRPASEDYQTLKSKHMLADSSSTVPLHLLATKIRTKYDFLEGFTSLHMFVVTLRCDHSCPYCQVSRVTTDRHKYDMSPDTAVRAVDWVFRSPSPVLKIEFQGGEALLNFERVRQIVELVERRNAQAGRQIEFVIATNLALLDDEMLSYCAEHRILLSSSLDGPEELHNANRPRPGHDSHRRFSDNLARARAVLGKDRVGALMTTTERSLEQPEAIIDEYVRLGFESVFVRPISPYGFAVRTKLGMRYQVDSFLEFYKRAFRRVIFWNRQGVHITETYAQIILRKLLTPFSTGYVDLQSPSGLGISAIVYNYNGEIYASDEGRMLAEMGDFRFRLGHLDSDDYQSVMGGDNLRGIIEDSIAMALPSCSDCAFVPYCGSDPVYNWTTQRNVVGHRPTSGFCRKHMGLFRYLIDTLGGEDDFTRQLMNRWATS